MWHSDRAPADAEERTGRDPDLVVPGPSEEELEALDRLGTEGRWTLQGRELRLTNLDKPLFPARPGEHPVTKRDLVRYYTTVGPFLLPHLADRPVNLHRFPNGADHPGFWHKQVPDYAPDWLHAGGATSTPAPASSERYFVIDSVPALAWMANYAALEATSVDLACTGRPPTDVGPYRHRPRA